MTNANASHGARHRRAARNAASLTPHVSTNKACQKERTSIKISAHATRPTPESEIQRKRARSCARAIEKARQTMAIASGAAKTTPSHASSRQSVRKLRASGTLPSQTSRTSGSIDA